MVHGTHKALAHTSITILILLLLLPYAEPFPPTNLRAVKTSENVSNLNVRIEWEQPTGKGPKFIVEWYQFSIESEFGLHNSSGTVFSTSLDVSLAFNVYYTASVIAVNCVGESSQLIVKDILFGKHKIFLVSNEIQGQ